MDYPEQAQRSHCSRMYCLARQRLTWVRVNSLIQWSQTTAWACSGKWVSWDTATSTLSMAAFIHRAELSSSDNDNVAPKANKTELVGSAQHYRYRGDSVKAACLRQDQSAGAARVCSGSTSPGTKQYLLSPRPRASLTLYPHRGRESMTRQTGEGDSAPRGPRSRKGGQLHKPVLGNQSWPISTVKAEHPPGSKHYVPLRALKGPCLCPLSHSNHGLTKRRAVSPHRPFQKLLKTPNAPNTSSQPLGPCLFRPRQPHEVIWHARVYRHARMYGYTHHAPASNHTGLVSFTHHICLPLRPDLCTCYSHS